MSQVYFNTSVSGFASVMDSLYVNYRVTGKIIYITDLTVGLAGRSIWCCFLYHLSLQPPRFCNSVNQGQGLKCYLPSDRPHNLMGYNGEVMANCPTFLLYDQPNHCLPQNL